MSIAEVRSRAFAGATTLAGPIVVGAIMGFPHFAGGINRCPHFNRNGGRYLGNAMRND